MSRVNNRRPNKPSERYRKVPRNIYWKWLNMDLISIMLSCTFFFVCSCLNTAYLPRDNTQRTPKHTRTHKTNITISRLITTAHVQIWEYCECELFIESEYSVPSYSVRDIISNPVYSFVGRTKVSDTHTRYKIPLALHGIENTKLIEYKSSIGFTSLITVSQSCCRCCWWW